MTRDYVVAVPYAHQAIGFAGLRSAHRGVVVSRLGPLRRVQL